MAVEGVVTRIDLSREGTAMFLGTLEGRVMNACWDLQDERGVFSIKDVWTQMGRDVQAYTTVSTTMGRLKDKGLLVRDEELFLKKRHRSWKVKVPEADLIASTVAAIVTKLLDCFRGEVLDALEGKISEQEL